MEPLLVLVGAAFLYGLYWLSRQPRLPAHESLPAVNPAKTTATDRFIKHGSDPLLMFSEFGSEGLVFPVSLDPQTPTRIKVCMQMLQTERRRLAQVLATRVLPTHGDGVDHALQFRRDWKAVCDVAEAEYGDYILFKALNLTGYERQYYP